MPVPFRLLAFLLLFATPLYAQTTYEGQVVDAANHTAIGYATVGLTKAKTGISTQEDGRFSLQVSTPKEDDTLVFQALGYEPLRIAVAAFSASGKIVFLRSKMHEIGEVAVRPKNFLQKVILNKHTRNTNHPYGSSGIISQVAQHFTAPASPVMLEEVTLRLPGSNPFMMGAEKSVFRLRIYGQNLQTKGPGEDLCTQSIEVRSKESKVVVDLRPYKIMLPEKDFFVALEWLKIPENEYWTEGKMDNNGTKRLVHFAPSLDFSRNKTPEENTWMLDYNGEWLPIMLSSWDPPCSNFDIEAQIRY